ncbi:kinase-like protein [Byssothecium circinans]|uniref:EKC/KEOPS complex subunit BUD32 n=1 Tax=Byssothecium circinans TaxID=147558 RepID=A0A6A5UI29_9PLEO|nr:kinase-like protein [Byssothecium circinans]
MEIPEPDIIIYPWYPPRVKTILASGANNYIGLVGVDTVLKFPQLPPEKAPDQVADGKIYAALRQEAVFGLTVEKEILKVLGHNDRIIGFKGEHEDGLLLEYMPNGSVADYLCGSNPLPPLKKRLKWALQAAEAVAYVHKKSVLHCDISGGNLLLDKDLNIKLCDFQGRLLHSDGTVLLDGGSAEGVRSSMPRADPTSANRKTDIFALGSAIYFMMSGRPPFSELDSWKDREEIERRFKTGQFPPLGEIQGGGVVKRCWTGRYESADQAIHDLKELYTAQIS